MMTEDDEISDIAPHHHEITGIPGRQHLESEQRSSMRTWCMGCGDPRGPRRSGRPGAVHAPLPSGNFTGRKDQSSKAQMTRSGC